MFDSFGIEEPRLSDRIIKMADPFYDEPYLYEDKAVRIDYSVLSVGVMTLGLILIVEVARHKLDHHVEHSVFYKAVLEGVYSERTYDLAGCIK